MYYSFAYFETIALFMINSLENNDIFSVGFEHSHKIIHSVNSKIN